MNTQSRSRSPRKEAFFVRVEDTEGTPRFFNATDRLGQPMPFAKPQATCAMRAGADVVAFSLLHLSKRVAANLAETPMTMPVGPLARLERKAVQVEDLGPADLVVEIDEQAYRLHLTRDDNGVVTLEADGEDVQFTLGRAATKLSLYLRSPRVDRVLAVGFIGFLGKPETAETVTRAAAMVLFSLTQLTEFKILSGVETVNVPAAPNRWVAQRSARKADERVEFIVPVQLFDGEPLACVATGEVAVEVDLENVNPTAGRLLFHYTPSKSIAEVFDQFRSTFDLSVNAQMTSQLGPDDVTGISYEIVLGEVAVGTIGRLKDAAKTLVGLDVSPRGQYRLWDAPVEAA